MTTNRPKFLSRYDGWNLFAAVLTAGLIMLVLLVFALLVCTAFGSDSELARHQNTFNRTYMVPTPWEDPASGSKQENPEDVKHIRTVPGRG